MNLLILSSHAVLEHDDLALFSGLGYDVFIPGAYSDPSHPGEGIRPPLPNAPHHPELAALCHEQRVKHANDGSYAIDWAKADLHPDLIDWADVVMVNCFPEMWLVNQWGRLLGKRVIWRTIGQSGPDTERVMKPLHSQGLEIIRYSPAEKRAFGRYDWFAGEDAMIRFAKDPAEWYGWTGSDPVVGNVTQNMVERGEFTGLRFWREATKGLPVKPAGAGSERIGGVGQLTYDGLREYLRSIRVYLYTGTQPASYTLGLIEAMMTGVPVVSIGPSQMWAPDLFEGHEIASIPNPWAYLRRDVDVDVLGNTGPWRSVMWADDPAKARTGLLALLSGDWDPPEASRVQRQRAIDLFGIDTIGRQWTDYLGSPVRAREAVTA